MGINCRKPKVGQGLADGGPAGVETSSVLIYQRHDPVPGAGGMILLADLLAKPMPHGGIVPIFAGPLALEVIHPFADFSSLEISASEVGVA
jgi:hypothetical protein